MDVYVWDVALSILITLSLEILRIFKCYDGTAEYNVVCL